MEYKNVHNRKGEKGRMEEIITSTVKTKKNKTKNKNWRMCRSIYDELKEPFAAAAAAVIKKHN